MLTEPVISALTEMLGRIPYDYEIDYHCYCVSFPTTGQVIWFFDDTPFLIKGA